MAKTLVVRGSLMLALSTVLFAQRPSTGGGAPAPTAGRLPPTNSIPNPSTNPAPNGADLQRPVYVAGKVIMEDGTAPPESLAIQMVCAGTPRSIGFTDMKGRFDLDLNDRKNAIYSDASQSGPFISGSGNSGGQSGIRQQAGGAPLPSTRNYMGCDLQAALAGFRSDRVTLNNHRALEDPSVGVIVLHRLANVQGLTISATSAMAPKDARKAFEKALTQEQKGKWPDAERELQKAVDAFPKYAAAWYHLGYAQQHQNNVADARLSYAKSLEADPRFVSPYQELAVLAAREQKWPEVAQHTDRLLNLNPIDFPDAWMYNAIANLQMQKFDAAERSARQGLSSDPGHRYPKLDQILGIALAQKHEYPEAALHMRSYLQLAPESTDASLVRKQLAEVERRLAPEAASKTSESKLDK